MEYEVILKVRLAIPDARYSIENAELAKNPKLNGWWGPSSEEQSRDMRRYHRSLTRLAVDAIGHYVSFETAEEIFDDLVLTINIDGKSQRYTRKSIISFLQDVEDWFKTLPPLEVGEIIPESIVDELVSNTYFD